MSLRIRLAALTAALTVTACGRTVTPAASTTLTVTFDGGYAFVQQLDDTMTVDALNHDHRMVLWLDNGTVEGNATLPSGHKKYTWKLDRKKLNLSVGDAGRVELPIVRELRQPDVDPRAPKPYIGCTADPDDETPDANNGFYWPELNIWAGGAVTERPASFEAQVGLKGGKLQILRAGGCFELRDHAGQTVLHRPMVLGKQSVRFSGALSEPKLTFTLDGLDPVGMGQPITILPAGGRIDLKIMHLDEGEMDHDVPTTSLPREVKSFQMYFDLLGIPGSNTLWVQRNPPPAHPGDECVMGFLSYKHTAVPPYIDPLPPDKRWYAKDAKK